jgi:cytochrome c
MAATRSRMVFAGAAALGVLLTVLAHQVRAAPQELTPREQVQLGRQLTERNCGMCHAVGSTGVSRDPEAPPFRHLNRRMKVDDLGEGLATGILTGHPAMPQFRFEPHEVVSIVRYLRSIQAQPRT